MSTWWRCLEDMDAEAVEAHWRRRTGTSYEPFRNVFLTRSERRARRFPSPHVCECGLRVVRQRDGKIVGVSDCGTLGCENIALTEEDIRLWEVSWAKLAQAVARAFGCEAKRCDLNIQGTQQVAMFGGVLPLVLTLQRSEVGFASAVAQLVAVLKERFILLAPTDRHFDANIQGLLNGAKAGFFSLESHVALLANGKLQAAKPAGELFAAHLPEMKDAVRESEIVRALQMFGGLMGLGVRLKKAPPARVFDLMVFKKKTKSETATACKCVASLITKRVALIEDHFQMPMAKLLALSSTMQDRLRTVKGDRYAKKKHGAMRDEPEQYKDEDDSAPQEEYRYDEGSADD